MKETDQIRAFIAIELPGEIIEEIVAATEGLKSRAGQLRWGKGDGIHLTLKFLGDIDKEKVDTIAETLIPLSGEHDAMELSLGRPGVFPDLKRPRVIWLGLEGEIPQLAALQQKVEKASCVLGFAAEKRSFAPHLTLARTKRGKVAWQEGDLSYIMEELSKLSGSSFRVDAFHLIRSDLKPDGALYTILKSFPLRGQAGGKQ